MDTLIYLLIIIFGSASYIIGIRQMLKNQYSPSTFSRVVWVLLSFNSFAGILLSKGSSSSILLGLIFLIGNILICAVSFRKGANKIGYTEYFSLVILSVSILIWVFYDAPLINLLLSLFAHFIGGIPTYKKVWLDPKSESFGFWSLFFIASLLSLFHSNISVISTIIFPIYFTIFDGIMSLLTLRKAPLK